MLLLGGVGSGLGALAIRYSAGKVRLVALTGLALGLLAIVVIAVVLVTSGR